MSEDGLMDLESDAPDPEPADAEHQERLRDGQELRVPLHRGERLLQKLRDAGDEFVACGALALEIGFDQRVGSDLDAVVGELPLS